MAISLMQSPLEINFFVFLSKFRSFSNALVVGSNPALPMTNPDPDPNQMVQF